jgi:N-acetylglucosamine-6-sulfatase
MGARSRRAGVLVVLAVVSAGCVYPTPPPGTPIPSLALSTDQSDPVAGVVTVTAIPTNIDPVEVTFRLDRIDSPPIVVDNARPFNASIDTARLSSGRHTVFALARDGTYLVRQMTTFTTRPNIVVVLVDDMDAMTMPLWDALPQTRAAIADRGMTFTNAFAPDPVCCPARASLLTGRYAHNAGVLTEHPVYDGYSAFVDSGNQDHTIATQLQSVGYRTSFAGKYLNGYELNPSAVPPGWDEWFGLSGGFLDGYGYQVNHNGTMELHGNADADYVTDVLAGEADSFLASTESNDGQPFFLFVATSAPHAAIPPARRHADHPFADDELPRHPNFDEADVTDKPEWLRSGVPPLAAAQIDNQQKQYRRMMGSMLAVDDLVARTVAQLDRGRELDSTILVFTSDNGFNFGAHRLDQKMAPYEESIRVPFAMAGPGVPHSTETAMVLHTDVTPTLLDFAGVSASDTVDGRSLRPLLTGSDEPWRDDFLVELNGTYNPYFYYHTLANVQGYISGGGVVTVPTYRGLRTEQYLYVRWYGGVEHEFELYDLVADPWELTNLLATPEGAAEHVALVAELEARLDELVDCAGFSCRT